MPKGPSFIPPRPGVWDILWTARRCAYAIHQVHVEKLPIIDRGDAVGKIVGQAKIFGKVLLLHSAQHVAPPPTTGTQMTHPTILPTAVKRRRRDDSDDADFDNLPSFSPSPAKKSHERK
ncbi:hypothetical protein GGX14DRAFT_397794 [Mycena pura]|uniref:Uncharacterized protein n=1 Tax=Mycena pura TaxID=153505 RepID=A0AAD6Y8F2_9AGAR|nr:hypothetical protein GGX14DRAFT_402166 [Mycena pura]KAJ7205249.1 hypothetical protein GGX14DRAFT_397794 [Mycena pura]